MMADGQKKKPTDNDKNPAEDRYSMIYEQPEEEDRESLPIKKPTRDRMKPTIA